MGGENVYLMMEHYSKGITKEIPLERKNVPIECLPENFLWMKVKPGSKMKNVLGKALTAFQDERVVLWTASGPAITKAISCAEIMKRKFKNLHQITRICFHKIEETWESIKEDLDTLVVTREIPTIHIMLSKDSLDSSELGYQGPGDLDSTFKQKTSVSGKKKIANRKGRPVTGKLKDKSPVNNEQKSSDESFPMEQERKRTVENKELETFNEIFPIEEKRNQKRKKMSVTEEKKEL